MLLAVKERKEKVKLVETTGKFDKRGSLTDSFSGFYKTMFYCFTYWITSTKIVVDILLHTIS